MEKKIKCLSCGKKFNKKGNKKYCSEQCGLKLRSRMAGTYKKYQKGYCEICKREKLDTGWWGNDKLRVHHIDSNIRNNKEENLLTCCFYCHGFLHSNKFKNIIELLNK